MVEVAINIIVNPLETDINVRDLKSRLDKYLVQDYKKYKK